MKRRLTAFFLIVVMFTVLFPLNALAASGSVPSAASIFLSQSQVQLQVGQQITLIAEVRPESAAATAVWVSQDESIATVDNGVITAVAAGDTTVSYEVGSLRALCSVTVSPSTQKQRSTMQDVIKVQGLINKIPETITLDDEQTIADAREAYDALTDAHKSMVSNTYLDKLLAAEYRLRVLKLPSVETIYQQTGDFLAGKETPDFGDEWLVIGLARSGKEVSSGYYDNVVSYVTNNIGSNERLDANESTENARPILALTAMGYDVTDVAGHNLLAGLDEMTYIQKQGIEGPIWTLIALDSHNYDPRGDVTRDKLVDSILIAQLADGGWASSGSTSEPIVTAKAIQALAPYSSTSAKSAVDKALTYLSGKQDSYGRFASADTAAQVVVALTALGIDPDTDDRFIKDDVSVLDALRTYAVDGCGFALIPGDSTIDDAVTEQGYNALTAYIRRKEGKTSLYNMSDVTIQQTHYSILSGGDGTWNADDKAYTIVINAPFAKFTGVKVDGTTIDPGNYNAKAIDNGTEVILSESYLKSLSLGTHSITLVLEEAPTVTTNLTIRKTDAVLAQEVKALIDAIGTVTKDSKAKIDAARKAYDALTSAQKALVTNYSTLTAAEKTYAELTAKITVYFTLLGDSKHGDNGEVHTLAQGGLQTWISRTAYQLDPGARVLDLLEKAIGGRFNNSHGNYVSSVDGLGEFDNGPNSGWMYTLNGTHPGLGVAQQKLSNGDEVVFHYTDDYTYEEDGGNYGKPIVTAKNVDALISQIGTVTFTDACKQKIDAARKAYDALSDAQKKKVTKLSILEAAEKKYDELKEAADKENVQNVIDLINKIGTPTLNSDEAINAAWDAYNALTADQKELVTNHSTLQSATQEWNRLKAEEVIKLIDKIDEPVTQQSEKAVQEARAAYDKLSDNQKKLVNNYKKLTDAETALAKLNATEEDKKKAQEVIDRIKKLTNVTLDSEKDIQDARKAYDALSDLQKKLVENYDVLEAAERKLALLKAMGKVGDPYATTGDYMEKLGTPSVGSIGGEWMVLGLARSDREIPNVADYYQSVVDYVRENIDENQRLHKVKSTDNSRIILALTAIGRDVTDVDGHNLLLGLNDLDFVKKQGNNGPIWALLALDSGNYPVPAGNMTRQALIDELLSVQTSDGGWAITGDEADSDMTGMALQALAPYYRIDLKVQEAVDKAIARLSEMQNDDGGFSTFGGGGKIATSESTSQVIVALTALGINPDTDERFVKNGHSAIDALLKYYVKGGGFKHVLDNQIDGMATEQAYYALTAYYRFLSGKTSLYDMTDVIDMGGDPVESPKETTVPATTEPAEVEPAESSAFQWWILALVLGVACGAGVLMITVIMPKFKKKD